MDYQHTTKDRSLGTIDLPIQDLVVSCQSKGLTSFESTGKRTFSEYLKTDGRKAVVKGRLHFEVEFHACKNMRFPPFNQPESDLEKVKTDDGASDIASTVDARFEDGGSVIHESDDLDGLEVLGSPIASDTPRLRTISTSESLRSQRRKQPDASQPMSAIEGPSSAVSAQSVKPPVLKKEELLQAQSGILVFNIMGGTIAKKNARLEFLFVSRHLSLAKYWILADQRFL